MKRLPRAILFYTGWILSPFTWWNDAFINIPLSYLMANMLFYITKLPFKWLVIGSYWFTNALGIYFMYFSGKYLILVSKNRLKAAVFIIIFVFIYSIILIYLDKEGKLLPLGEYFKKYCVKY